MEFHVITLFPEMFAAPTGPDDRSREAGLVSVQAHNLREHGLGNYRQVDDTPYGGGSGMVMRPEPIRRDRSALGGASGIVACLMTPQGERFDQPMAREFARQRPACC